ncbi:AAA family ATPase [Salmonirosea aquatica]|uniref:AAA family ATPase n=1 Tax=Salmonirosea aquatica TaxID=2654236 RepID=A0A7C9F1W2_9BACT|nr:AAA family ATPase [Cytophagaceae bacterium SJW1-29]
MKIKRLFIQNFKAFGPEQVLDFESKNILIYGNNGSGKSSIYAALHTFMQSSIIGKYWEKYFDSTHDENLLNRYISETEFPPFIQVELDDAFNSLYELNPNREHNLGYRPDDPNDSKIRLANLASDFMNYRLLSNFFHFRNSEDANVWPIFEKEILMYWQIDATSASAPTFEDELKSIRKELEALKDRRGLIRRTGRRGNDYSALLEKIENFNRRFADEFRRLLPDIEPLLGIFLDASELYKPVLEPIRILEISDEDPYAWKESIINLTLECDKTLTSRVPKPQSFLNEARLTALALSIRLAMVGQKFKGIPGRDDLRILVLDDLLISLDMSNRMKVIKYLRENEDFQNYQLIILTHDKGFYNILRNSLAADAGSWKWFELYEQAHLFDGEGRFVNPLSLETKDSLKKAREFLDANDFEACALYLRKKTEELLRIFFDPTLMELTRFTVFKELVITLGSVKREVHQQLIERFKRVLLNDFVSEERLENLKSLALTAESGADDERHREIGQANSYKNDVFNYLIEHYKNDKEAAEKLVESANKLNEIRGRVLNLGAHYGDEALYRAELEEAYNAVKDFETGVKRG